MGENGSSRGEDESIGMYLSPFHATVKTTKYYCIHADKD